MADTVIEIGRPHAAGLGDKTELLDVRTITSQEITGSGTSQASTISAAQDGYACTIINGAATAVWVAFGATPTAAVGTTSYVPAGQSRDFGGLREGDKVAVINDS